MSKIASVIISIFILMDLFMLYTYYLFAKDGGVSMGLGFMQLTFLVIGLPLGIAFYTLQPAQKLWLIFLPFFILFFILLFAK